MRAELYQGIVDSVSKGELRGNEVGKRIVLPATFIGGPRDMRRRYLDALALVQRFGKSDLFITITCNPEWKEIQENLYVGQSAQDRPDLTSRIFRAKLQALRDQLFKDEIFGHVAAHVHVIEFQKRGLPHVHMLIIFRSEDKIHTADQIDKFVSAELPDEEKYPQLFELVKKHMMHGPCGEKNPKNSCMAKAKCKCHYPRAYCESTIQGKDGYPIYRRRNNGSNVRVRGADLDNLWVVPYNTYLLSTYNCHINGEVVETVLRYRITLNVTADEHNARITIFHSTAAVYVGCSEDEYISSISESENNSAYYRGLNSQATTVKCFMIALQLTNIDDRGILNITTTGIEKMDAVDEKNGSVTASIQDLNPSEKV